MTTLATILMLWGTTPSANAGELGSYETSTRYITADASSGRPIWFQVHYPAVASRAGEDVDLSRGPYPVVALMHGYLGAAWMYNSAANAFASMGLIVVNMDTETHPFMDPYALGDYTLDALRWVEDSSADDSHWLAGAPDNVEPWTLMAHSLGSVSMAYIVDMEPRVNNVVGFAAYRDDEFQWDAYADFNGAALWIGGNEDLTSPPAVVQGWFDDMDQPSRSVLAIIDGAGHQAITDIAFDKARLSEQEQLDANIHLTVGFLRAELLGEEDHYDQIICSAPVALERLASHSEATATSVVIEDSDRLRLGLLANEGTTATIYLATAPGQTSTEHGELGLHQATPLEELDLTDGQLCHTVTLGDEHAGAAWLQVAYTNADNTVMGRVIDAFQTGAAEPTPEEDDDNTDSGADSPIKDDDDAGEDEPSTSSDTKQNSVPSGCSVAPVGGTAWLLLSSVLITRQRRRK